MAAETKTRIAILGASGYLGGELVRLLVRHPAVEIAVLTADRRANQPMSAVFPHLAGLDLPVLQSIEDVEWAGVEVDFVFCALPHGTTQEIVAGLLHATHHSLTDEMLHETTEDIVSSVHGQLRIVDVSADFRLTDTDVYAKWYGHAHRAPELQGAAVYGLTEFARDRVTDARLVANPGCYPTSALLPLVPLLAARRIEPEGIVIDAKSGVSGAGRSERLDYMFTEVSEGIHAYATGGHRHAPEIEQELSGAASAPVTVTFMPHLVPMNRGILETIYVRLAQGVHIEDLRETLETRFADEPFVRVLPEGLVPATRHVRGSNHCHIGVAEGGAPGTAILFAAIDNLVKGGSGQAVQNMNVMLGYPETMGLEQEPLFP